MSCTTATVGMSVHRGEVAAVLGTGGKDSDFLGPRNLTWLSSPWRSLEEYLHSVEGSFSSYSYGVCRAVNFYDTTLRLAASIDRFDTSSQHSNSCAHHPQMVHLWPLEIVNSQTSFMVQGPHRFSGSREKNMRRLVIGRVKRDCETGRLSCT